MIVCPQCNIEYEPGKEFCDKCGKFLLIVEDPESKKEIKARLVCPKCKLVYKQGSYCKRCGSLLMQKSSPPAPEVQPVKSKLLKKMSKEWLALLKDEKELESCMSKLETQQDRVSGDVLNPLYIRYKNRLELLLPLEREVKGELESNKSRISKDIEHLENELKPIQKRLEEFQSLHKLGAILKRDFIREKKILMKEIKSREKDIRKHRQVLSLLPVKMGGTMVSPGLAGDLRRSYTLRPFSVILAGLVIVLIITGGFVILQRTYISEKNGTEKVAVSAASSIPQPPPQILPSETEKQELEKIKSLFENIKKANLRKDIDLFMSCYSNEFAGKEAKRLSVLQTWKYYNYLGLSYDLKKQDVSGETANVIMEWTIRIAKMKGGREENNRSLSNVILKKEDGSWKIREIK